MVLVLSACGANETLVLLRDDDGKVGALALLNQDGSDKGIVMNKVNQMTRIDGAGSIQTMTASQQDLDKDFAATLETLPAQSKHFILYFEMASTRVKAESQKVLVALFDEVAGRQAVEVLVTGHTDTIGLKKDNDQLAMKRAQKVREMLMERGLKASFVWAAGRGERELLIKTADETAEPRNRRVEIIVR